MAQTKRKGRGRGLRLRPGETLAAISALALFALLFLPWYDVSNAESKLSLPGSAGAEQTAWDALEVVAPVLTLACLLSLGLVAARLLRPGWKPAISPSAAIAVLGGFATLLVLARIGFPPDLDGLVGIEYEATPTLAAFLSLAAAFGIAFGGYRAMRSEGGSFAAVADSLSREGRRGEAKDAGRPSQRTH